MRSTTCRRNSGDVPNLYKVEGVDATSQACRTPCQQAGLQLTKANIVAIYLQRVKKNVHAVLAFSPVGDAFRNRLRMFPSLVNCCAIDWFQEWPAEALYCVANQQRPSANAQLDNMEGALNLFKIIHQMVEEGPLKVLAATKRNVDVPRSPTSSSSPPSPRCST